MNKHKLEGLIDDLEDAVRAAIGDKPDVLEVSAKIARSNNGLDPSEHTLAGAVAVAKSIGVYVDAGCADGTLQPYGANAHANVDAAAKVLRAALAALDGLHKEFPKEEPERADA